VVDDAGRVEARLARQETRLRGTGGEYPVE
jgi:hypothetical protein